MLCWLLFPLATFCQGNDLLFYSVEDGLAQSQVYAMTEDPRGFIWLGTQGGGISRFDGKNFVSFNERAGLASNYVFSLHYASDNQLWIGTNYGVSRYDGQRFFNYLNDRKGAVIVNTIQEIDSGVVWLGTDKGLFVFEDNKPVDVRFPAYKFFSIFKDLHNHIWLTHAQGVIEIDGEQVFRYTTEQGLPPNEISDIWVDSLNRIWVSTYADGLYQKEGNRFEPVSIKGIPKGALVWDLFMDNKERLWISTYQQGAIGWNPNDSSTIQLDAQVGLLKQHVRRVFEDSWGNIWLGTSGEGLAKYAGKQFVHYGRQSTLRGQSVYALALGKDSSIWLSQGNQGLRRFQKNAFSTPDLSPTLNKATIRGLYTDYRGRIWIGADRVGLGIWKDSLQVQLNRNAGLSTPWIRDFTGDTLDNIWAATGGGGIVRLKSEEDSTGIRAQVVQILDDLPYSRVNTLHRDQRDRIWFGLNREGIGYIDRDSSINIVSVPIAFKKQPVRCLVEDDAGFLWVGTGGGILRLDMYGNLTQPKWKTYQSELTSANVYLLTFDAEANLWIGSAEGVDRASLDADQYIIDIKHFGQSEGFLGVETCSDAVLIDPESNIWFGTISGLTRFDPRNGKRNTIPPKLSLKEATLYYTPFDSTKYAGFMGPWGQMKSGLILPARRNHLSFDFIAINHTNPEQVLYQWKLDGLESEWSPPTSKHDATYSNIPSGTYSFMVKAINEDGVESEPLTVSFTIKPPLWITWWFILLMVAALSLIIVGIFYYRLNQVKRKNQAERQRLELEKSMVELEQKALRLQMNPHFIFHALNSIQGLIITEDPKTARYYLSKFSRLMRQVLENSREGLISLADEIETLENYLELEKFCREQSFDYAIHIKGDWDSEIVLIPPMVLQPFVENAIIHGVSHLDGRKGQVDIVFEKKTEILLCKIRDNGVGRKIASSRKQELPIPKKSTALKVTKERLRLLKPYAPKQESIRIIDLVDPEGQSIGTEVQVAIPFELDV